MRRSSSLSPSGEAAEIYGIEVKRGGMACCPFHDDKNPSMKLNRGIFLLLWLRSHGRCDRLYRQALQPVPKEAAEKLAQDFGLIYDSQAPPRGPMSGRKPRRRSFRRTDSAVIVYCPTTTICSQNGKPTIHPKHRRKNHPRFMEAIQKKAYVGLSAGPFFWRKARENKRHGLPNTHQKSPIWKGE